MAFFNRYPNHTQPIPTRPPFYSPLPYPFVWYIHNNEAIIINAPDLYTDYLQTQQPVYQLYPRNVHQEATDEEVVILDGFDQETEPCCNGGLTKKVVFEKLKVLKYRKDGEEGEVCVVCQAEFESNERLGVLDCKHRFHSGCIRRWLVRKNVCPLCKGQALRV